jgi:hypothetical protein
LTVASEVRVRAKGTKDVVSAAYHCSPSHLGKRAPKDLTAPLTWFTSCVRQLTNAWLQWVEQFRIQTCEASQILGIDLISLALGGVDEAHLAGISHQDLMAALL